MLPLSILHVAPYSGGAWAYGGIPRLATTLTRELARRGHRVTFSATDVCTSDARLDREPVAPGRSHPPAHRSAWPAFRTADGVTVRIFPNLSNRLAYHAQIYTPIGLGAFVARHAGSFDVAHLHACRNLPGVAAAHALRHAGVPYVLAPNGTAPRLERRFLSKRLFDLAAGHRVAKDAARLLAVSHAEERQLESLGIDRDAIRTIPNPVDLDEFDPPVERGRFRAGAGLGSGPLVLYLGKLTPRKRLDVLIHAFADLDVPEAALVIAGNDMGAAKRARALVHARGITERTRFTGLLEGRARLEALADATVVVYPSEHEIFGLVPLEALLSGTPVIVAGDSGSAEVVTRTGGGLIVPVGDVLATGHAMRTILDHPGAWRMAVTDAAARVRSLYGGAAVAARVEDVYRDLLERSHAR